MKLLCWLGIHYPKKIKFHIQFTKHGIFKEVKHCTKCNKRKIYFINKLFWTD